MALRQGQHAACRRYTAIPNDHRTVVQRCFGEKDIAKQLLRHLTVNLGAGFEVFIDGSFTGKYDQRTDALFAHDLTGHYCLRNDSIQFLRRL